MSPEGKKGKVYDFNEFRKKKGKEPIKSDALRADNSPSSYDQTVENSSKKLEEHTGEHHHSSPCVICEMQKEGLPITEVYDHVRELNHRTLPFNSRHLQQWVQDLRPESLMELSNRILAIDKDMAKKNPTYTHAIIKVYWEKLKQKMAAFSPSEKED